MSQEAAGAFGRVEKTNREMLLPEPPIGQLEAVRICAMDLASLEEVAQSRGIELERMFKPNEWAKFTDETARIPTWTRENATRVALLYLDGQSPAEYIDTVNAALLAQGRSSTTVNSLGVRLGELLSDEGKEQAGQNRLVRKWHEYLGPQNGEREQELSALEDLTGVKRHRMFVHPADRQGDTRGKRTTGRIQAGKNLFSADVVIRMAYLRFVEKREPAEVAKEVSELIGKVIPPEDLPMVYTRALTKEAKEALGIEAREPLKVWKKTEYKTAARLFLMDDSATYEDIANELGRTTETTFSGLQYEGKRLQTRDKYRNVSWLAALLLEYGDTRFFPFPREGDRLAVVERVAALHSREKRVPESGILAA